MTHEDPKLFRNLAIWSTSFNVLSKEGRAEFFYAHSGVDRDAEQMAVVANPKFSVTCTMTASLKRSLIGPSRTDGYVLTIQTDEPIAEDETYLKEAGSWVNKLVQKNRGALRFTMSFQRSRHSDKPSYNTLQMPGRYPRFDAAHVEAIRGIFASALVEVLGFKSLDVFHLGGDGEVLTGMPDDASHLGVPVRRVSELIEPVMVKMKEKTSLRMDAMLIQTAFHQNFGNKAAWLSKPEEAIWVWDLDLSEAFDKKHRFVLLDTRTGMFSLAFSDPDGIRFAVQEKSLEVEEAVGFRDRSGCRIWRSEPKGSLLDAMVEARLVRNIRPFLESEESMRMVDKALEGAPEPVWTPGLQEALEPGKLLGENLLTLPTSDFVAWWSAAGLPVETATE